MGGLVALRGRGLSQTSHMTRDSGRDGDSGGLCCLSLTLLKRGCCRSEAVVAHRAAEAGLEDVFEALHVLVAGEAGDALDRDVLSGKVPEDDLEPGVFDRLADGRAGRLGEGGVEKTARDAGVRRQERCNGLDGGGHRPRRSAATPLQQGRPRLLQLQRARPHADAEVVRTLRSKVQFLLFAEKVYSLLILKREMCYNSSRKVDCLL